MLTNSAPTPSGSDEHHERIRTYEARFTNKGDLCGKSLSLKFEAILPFLKPNTFTSHLFQLMLADFWLSLYLTLTD
jgi:hypothetical protein